MSRRTSPPSAFDPVTGPEPDLFDPVRLCVYTTIAVLAWLLTPAAVVALFSGIALFAYYRARRAAHSFWRGVTTPWGRNSAPERGPVGQSITPHRAASRSASVRPVTPIRA